ncbi:mechanosensitive ion channel domain-containing protein [Psychrobacter sp. P11G5]|uniref:mechanosensitive ion channel family protein n=1 Tax=Psychrobacter sp. P11G5 TaxID=1699624 RepID=UPI00078C6899|nr:mechanosensitive ion channel domain-containing protein [Psychrobacter sp. P11G5]AMN66552.1 transporter [Psychrobacter sp. P11G5]
MPTSEADPTLSAEAAATTADALTYQSIIDSANGILIGFVERIPYFVASIIVILIFWFLSIVFKKIVYKLLGSRSRHQNLVKVFQRVGGALIIFIGLMIAMVIAVPGFTPTKLIGALGIGSVAIGFAFKDIFQNLLSGILLLISEPFRIGDQIVSGDYEGTVEDIKIRATTIKTYDGRQVVIPNSDLYTSALTVNTAYKQRRLQLAVGIGYADDINEAKAEIMQALSRADTVSKEATPTIIAVNLGDSTIDLIVRWFIDDGTQANKVSSIDQVLIEVKTALDAAGIDMPFPVRTLDMSDPSVKAMVKSLNKQNDASKDQTETTSLITE